MRRVWASPTKEMGRPGFLFSCPHFFTSYTIQLAEPATSTASLALPSPEMSQLLPLVVSLTNRESWDNSKLENSVLLTTPTYHYVFKLFSSVIIYKIALYIKRCIKEPSAPGWSSKAEYYSLLLWYNPGNNVHLDTNPNLISKITVYYYNNN